MRRMKGGTFGLGVLLLAAHLPGCQTETQQEREVISLIDALASPVPPLHEDQSHDWGFECEPKQGDYRLCRPSSFFFGGRHENPQVTAAAAKLIGMGTRIYPILVKYRDDKRYSFSLMVQAWINHSVGTKIMEILGDGIEFGDGSYFDREHPGGSNFPPRFWDYLDERDRGEWARHAAASTKLQLRREYVEWAIAKERSYGFLGNAQEHEILDPYLQELTRIDRELLD